MPWESLPSMWFLDRTLRKVPEADREVGRRRVEAVYRSDAAIALEAFGADEVASREWSKAFQLWPERTREHHREFALRRPEQREAHRQAIAKMYPSPQQSK